MNVSTFFSTFVYFFVGSTDSLKIVSYLIFISGIISIPNIKILYFKRYFNTFCLNLSIQFKIPKLYEVLEVDYKILNGNLKFIHSLIIHFVQCTLFADSNATR